MERMFFRLPSCENLPVSKKTAPIKVSRPRSRPQPLEVPDLRWIAQVPGLFQLNDSFFKVGVSL